MTRKEKQAILDRIEELDSDVLAVKLAIYRSKSWHGIKGLRRLNDLLGNSIVELKKTRGL